MTTAQLDVLVDEVYPHRPPRPTQPVPCPSGWRRSYRGNLTKYIGSRHLTVFCLEGRFKWCLTIHDTDHPQGEVVTYSPRDYPTEQAALSALLAASRRVR